MNKSLYFELVQKYFPQLVLSIVERLNEKRVNQLPYLFKELLAPTFSADGRWASVLAEYNRVAADVVALDSELPLKSRDSIETASGDIPKLGMKLYLTEKQMKDIDAMIAQGLPINQVLNKVFNDLPRCIEGVWERVEDMFLSGLSTGVALSTRNNGTGVRVDYNYLAKNKFGVAVQWADPTNATPLTDLQNTIFDKAIDDQNTITDLWMDDFALRNFYKAKEVRAQFAFDSQAVAVDGSSVPVLDFDKAALLYHLKSGYDNFTEIQTHLSCFRYFETRHRAMIGPVHVVL
ncbi:MAG: major capsid protein [Bacteroidales bacterium]|nr:major capsid protein [Bacteroidales bacterium]